MNKNQWDENLEYSLYWQVGKSNVKGLISVNFVIEMTNCIFYLREQCDAAIHVTYQLCDYLPSSNIPLYNLNSNAIS